MKVNIFVFVVMLVCSIQAMNVNNYRELNELKRKYEKRI